MGYRVMSAIAGLCLLAICLPAFAADVEGLAVGEKAPNIIGRDMDGKLFMLSKMEPGKKVVSFFWVNCLPCKKELPEMAAMAKKYAAVRFVAVHAADDRDNKLPGFLKEIGSHPAPVIADASITERYKFKAFPHTVVLSEDNRALMVLSGFNEDNMKRLDAFLSALK